MDVKEAVETRRAYRALAPFEVGDDLIRDLARMAGLAPSCFNKQPWRFVFVRDPEVLDRVFDGLSAGNGWARQASLVVAVTSRKDLDCVTAGREYYLFDTGMATALLILRATELGLTAHPMAGFDGQKVRKTLDIPEDMELVTLLAVGRHTNTPTVPLSEKQRELEASRPQRLPFEAMASVDRYTIREP